MWTNRYKRSRLRAFVQASVVAGITLIAADSGGQIALAWDLTPLILVGDMDSIDPTSLVTLRANPAIEIHQSQVEKDETDLELALYAALDHGFRDLTIVGGLGGRLDHTLGNLYLLAAPRLLEAGAKVRLLSEHEEVYLLRGGESLTLAGQPGELLSLVPLTLVASGIRTDGLYYPLRSEPLYLGPSRGISNQFVGEQATVSFEEGLLLVIHQFA